MTKMRLVAGVVAALVFSVAAPGAVAMASPSSLGHVAGDAHKGDPHHGSGSDRDVAVVSIESGPYGPVLVVGGAGTGYVPSTPGSPGTYNFPAGSSLYRATIDPPASDLGGHPYPAGCTTVVDPTAGFACTGSSVADSSDWPALTTDGPPVAGPGVERWLLGEVYRADLGTDQVTYAGQPLYLFDPGPDSFFGANFFESVAPLPPWHTAWYLVGPDGRPATGPATLELEAPTPQTAYTSPVIGAEMLPNAVPGGAAITAYSFSRDGHHTSQCNEACAREFIPVLTSGTPAAASGVPAGGIGVIERSDGTHQVTYDGRPLYLFSQEEPAIGPGGPITTGSIGNGNGVHAFGGTFNVVAP